jgi:DNA-3-methyladenine glycosylase I
MTTQIARSRCTWAQKPIFHDYHDTEWGVPVHDDRVHFEFLILEAAQAGLSWETVLKKRQEYRRVFADFDPVIVATFGPAYVERLMGNAGIIRNRAKITAAIQNAQAFLVVQQAFGSFDKYVWSFVNGMPIVNPIHSPADYPSRSALSDALSADLKKRGFAFVGSTIIYAYLQATGLINDHEVGCFCK